MPKPLIVTTSWDDGDVLDMRLAELLTRYGLKGTFYITKSYRPERVSDEQLRMLSRDHEVGAHTLTHPDLRTLSREKKREEIEGSKQWIERVLGIEVPMFCYPTGLYDEEAIEVVRDAGFIGARTTELARLDRGSEPYRLPTTLQVYPMPFRKKNAHQYRWGRLFEPFMQRSKALRRLGVPLASFRSFEALAKASFDQALTEGGIFHLWGHSWEIERYGLWEELERVLLYISNHPNCRYAINRELL